MKPAIADTQVSQSAHVTEPSQRAWMREISPATIEAARASADAGYYRIASDLAESILVDVRVRPVLSQRVDGVLSLPLKISHPRDEVVKAFEADFKTIFHNANYPLWIKRAIIAGQALCQLTWARAESGRVLPTLDPWSGSGLSLSQGQHWLEVERENNAFDRVQISFRAESKWQWMLLRPYGEKRPMHFGLWNSLVEWCGIELYGAKDWANASDSHGTALKILSQDTPESGAKLVTGQTLKDLASRVDQAAAGSVVALPPGVKFNFAELVSTSWQMYPGQIDKAWLAIAVCILGQNLTTEVKGGSFSAAQVHRNVARDVIVATAAMAILEAVLPIARQWELINFGTSLIELEYDLTDPDEGLVVANKRKANAESMQIISAIPGLNADMRKLAKECNISLLEGKAQQLKPAALSAASDPILAPAVVGQLEIDRLSSAETQAAMEPLLAALEQAIEKANSFDELEAELRRIYSHLDAEGLANALEQSLQLASSIGAFSAS